YYTFGIGQTNPNISKEIIQRFESEADFYGCFYGELSGYATGRVFPRVLDLIYQQFNLSDRLNGYPTKEERKTIYASKQKEAIQMVATFKAGQFLYLIQEFESAAQCFNYLVNQFPSREILNNLAAAKLQQALLLYSGREQSKFVYPIELDAKSRLASSHRGAPSEFNAKLFNQLLSEARRYSEQAKEADPGYVPAYINMACIYSLQGNQPAAIGIINELNPTRITGNAHTIRAIAYYKDSQPKKAQKDFEAAQQKGAHMAKYNLAVFNKLNKSATEGFTVWIRNWLKQEEPPSISDKGNSSQQEQIAGQEAATPLPIQAPTLKISKKPNLVIQWKEKNDHLALGIQTATRSYLVRLTQENYTNQTTRKIKQGTLYTNLINKYGKPAYTFPGTIGEYWVYTTDRVAFYVDKNGKVNSWLIYARIL
ncbi:MAG: hypothetical protein M3142_00905, partial [Bacteroidota bacterium]|nr:hypothetical protein [Bacteroidota bacterium]